MLQKAATNSWIHEEKNQTCQLNKDETAYIFQKLF